VRILHLILLPVLVLVVTFGGRVNAADAHQPVIGATRTAILVWLADELGYISSAGFEARMYQSGTLATRDLAAGRIQLATGSHVAFVSNALKSPDLRVVSTLSTSRTANLVGRGDQVGRTAVSLAGKRVGITGSSIGEFFLSSFLRLSGMRLSDLDIVDLRPNDIVAGLADGTLAAGLTWEPYVYQARQALGNLALSYPDQEGQYYYFLLVGRDAWLSENDPATGALMRALLKAEEFAHAEPDKAREIIRKRFDLDPGFINYLWPEHSLTIALPQDLVRLMEEAVIWRGETSDEATGRALPNMLDFIHSGPLRATSREAVGVFE
tara:strand:- start:6189 stop:7160 length:972 start_codon:yes stop_codon:yes gene_type:complete